MDQKKGKSEVVIPEGYRLDEVIDFDDDDFGEEEPILTEGVELRFERSDDQ